MEPELQETRRILRTSLGPGPILRPNAKSWVAFVIPVTFKLALMSGTTFWSKQLIGVRCVYRNIPNQSSVDRYRPNIWNCINVRNLDSQSLVIMAPMLEA